MKINIKKFDYVFSVGFFIMHSSSAFEELIFYKNYILLICYLYFFIRIIYSILHRKKINYDLILIFIIIFCFVSTFWSFDSSTTIVQSIYLFAQSIVVIFIANVFNWKDVFKLLLVSGLIITVCSYGVVYLYPEIGISHTVGQYGLWKGVFTHKNNLGNVMVFYVMLNYFIIYNSNKLASKIIMFFIICLQINLILKSGSTTALVLLMFITVLFIFLVILKCLKNLYLRISIISCSISFLILGIFILLNNIDNIMDFLGKDLTFSGRVSIWKTGIDLIKNRWLLGYGYKGTFTENSYFYNEFIKNITIPVNSLHSGYLEILSYIGVIGSIFVVSAIIVYIKYSIKMFNLNFYPIIFISFLLLNNLIESAFLGSGNGLLWSFFVYTLIYMKNTLNSFELQKEDYQ